MKTDDWTDEEIQIHGETVSELLMKAYLLAVEHPEKYKEIAEAVRKELEAF